jgi:hypothetical protein
MPIRVRILGSPRRTIHGSENSTVPNRVGPRVVSTDPDVLGNDHDHGRRSRSYVRYLIRTLAKISKSRRQYVTAQYAGGVREGRCARVVQQIQSEAERFSADPAFCADGMSATATTVRIELTGTSAQA